jgi:hypothetical protein
VTDKINSNIINSEVNLPESSAYQFSQIQTHSIPKTWIFLNNQLTIDVFQKNNMLNNICKSESRMDIYCNAGVTSTNIIGNFPRYGTVWYHPHGTANILSLARSVEKGYQVKYDSASDNTFTVNNLNSGTWNFKALG